MTKPVIIDVKMHGRDSITGAFVVQGERTALVETGPKSCVDHVFGGLRGLGIDSVDDIVVTHIHLDHAGAAGTLARHFPDATVHVHSVGAPHLADPGKLWTSASRIYGDQMEQLWGGIDPIDKDRVRTLEHGDVVDLGGRTLSAVETPGHAHHHHSYLDSEDGILYTGDALGVRLPDVGLVRPATAPPEFHLEEAIASTERIRSLGVETLCLTHFGPHTEGTGVLSVDEMCDRSIEALRKWAEWVRGAREKSMDLDEVAATVAQSARAAYEGQLAPDDVDRMEQTTSYWMNTWGYMRYFDKHPDAG